MFDQALNTPLMNEINFLVVIIIIINIYSGCIYKYNGSSPNKL